VMRREFLEAMIDLLGRDGRSVLFSSHILADVERVADRVGILHGGRLIVDVRLDDLKLRVQKRFARCREGANPFTRPIPGMLRARPVREGYDLTLVDFDAERERELRETCAVLSEPATPTLEELFIELTSEQAERVGGAA
jgi:ABC-2 type transport system ATP-binding protein